MRAVSNTVDRPRSAWPVQLLSGLVQGNREKPAGPPRSRLSAEPAATRPNNAIAPNRPVFDERHSLAMFGSKPATQKAISGSGVESSIILRHRLYHLRADWLEPWIVWSDGLRCAAKAHILMGEHEP
jgi:hypothetical protein